VTRELNREIFENAINVMKHYGVDSIINKKIVEKREQIKDSLLKYYESTDEYEKCQFVKDFFEELEIVISSKDSSC
jgi:hypothetical protein